MKGFQDHIYIYLPLGPQKYGGKAKVADAVIIFIATSNNGYNSYGYIPIRLLYHIIILLILHTIYVILCVGFI